MEDTEFKEMMANTNFMDKKVEAFRKENGRDPTWEEGIALHGNRIAAK